ncbi:MAG: hypothetical protein V9F04_11950 [Dermatophilaceae bacterium]
MPRLPTAATDASAALGCLGVVSAPLRHSSSAAAWAAGSDLRWRRGLAGAGDGEPWRGACSAGIPEPPAPAARIGAEG